MLFNYHIFKDGKHLKSLNNLRSDIAVYGYMQKIQSSSVDWALKHEGYLIEVEDVKTGIVVNWLTDMPIVSPLCRSLK